MLFLEDVLIILSKNVKICNFSFLMVKKLSLSFSNAQNLTPGNNNFSQEDLLFDYEKPFTSEIL